jgi:hypothetical protein
MRTPDHASAGRHASRFETVGCDGDRVRRESSFGLTDDRQVLGLSPVAGEGRRPSTEIVGAPVWRESSTAALDARPTSSRGAAYETITGRKAFGGTSQAAVLAATLRDEPPALGTIQPVAPALDRAIGKCLTKNPDDRWQTARDLESELRWIRQDSGRSDGWGSSASGREYAGRVPRRMMIVGFAVLVVVSALAAFLMRNQSARDIAPIEFTVAAPEGSAFIDSGSFLAVSPDGPAFLARGLTVECCGPAHGDRCHASGRHRGDPHPSGHDSQHIGFVASRNRLKQSTPGCQPARSVKSSERSAAPGIGTASFSSAEWPRRRADLNWVRQGGPRSR